MKPDQQLLSELENSTSMLNQVYGILSDLKVHTVLPVLVEQIETNKKLIENLKS